LSNSNHLLKKGHELLKRSMQTKRPLHNCNDESTKKQLGSSEFNNKTTSSAMAKSSKSATSNDSFSMLKKFSFLSKDQSYLTRLSNYVSKSIVPGTEGVSKISSTRNAQMVFTRLDTEINECDQSNDNKNEKIKSKEVS
jgi:hypothetical protein